MRTWKAVCQRCGKPGMAADLSKEARTGLRVCAQCKDPLHPQEKVRGRVDRQTPPWTSPRPEPVYITPGPEDWDDL